jgi:ABC-2 type transport system permease protein
VLPVSHLPGPLAALADILPAAALADAFRVALGSGDGDLARSLVILAVWGFAAVALAIRTFRWE